MQILDYVLKMTCGACPEQYDVFDSEGKQAGYLRLRGDVSVRITLIVVVILFIPTTLMMGGRACSTTTKSENST